MNLHTTKFISVIINYNSKHYIDVVINSIDSLINAWDVYIRGSAPVLIFILDNGSTDKSIEIIEENVFKKNLPKNIKIKIIKFRSNYNYGGAFEIIRRFLAYNGFKGILHIMNNDLIISRFDTFEKVIDIVREIPKISAVQPLILFPNNTIFSAGDALDELLRYFGLCKSLPRSECIFPSKAYPVTYTSGAFSVYNFLHLRKYSELLPLKPPGYFDDNIVGLTLWNDGLPSFTITEAIGYHITSLSYGPRKIQEGIKAYILLDKLVYTRYKYLTRLISTVFDFMLTKDSSIKIYKRMSIKNKLDLYKAPYVKIDLTNEVITMLRKMFNVKTLTTNFLTPVKPEKASILNDLFSSFTRVAYPITTPKNLTIDETKKASLNLINDEINKFL